MIDSRRAARVRAYLDLIKSHEGGAEAVAPATPGDPGLESAGTVPDDASVAAANAGLAAVKANRDPTPEQLVALEAIILPRERPAVDIVDGDFFTVHPLWQKLNDDAAINARLRAAIPAIGRIELPGQSRIPYAGTGFLVGANLLMTNRHVAEIFASGLGDRGLRFRPGAAAAIDFRRERDRVTTDTLRVTGIRMLHPYWDMALLEVEGASDRAPLQLALMPIDDLEGREVAVIGYPAFDPVRNDRTVQNALFNSVYGVKRLQPGRLGKRRETSSFGRRVNAATHDSSTLGGNSGSAIVDLATGDVVGLHFGGRYLDTNYGVPASELARDGRIIDAGVAFAGRASGGTPPWQAAWSANEAPSDDDPERDPDPDAAPLQAAPASSAAGDVTMTIPLHITVRLGTAGSAIEAAAGTPPLRLVEPFHDSDYASRRGYDPDFLGVAVAIPAPADASVIAPLKDGGSTLAYANFSIIMHARRRLALVTAANVTAAPALTRPEPGFSYSRRALSGLGAFEIEKWFPDPRLAARFQLPDAFFSEDAGAFDKGHIVRRNDIAWGASHAALRRANGDSYHVTNCSPQVAGFNQSTRGRDNWGDLEGVVLRQASSEKLCVLAGPILADDDETFVGTGARGRTLRARIPRAFWKIIVAEVEGGIAAFGFVLEQDLAAVPLEFTVPANFTPFMLPIATIAARTGLVFDAAILAADQFGNDRAEELTWFAGLGPEAPTPNSGDDADVDAEPDRTLPPTEAPIDWRVATALLTLRAQINARFPGRSKAADGTIGDAMHATRNSDHNPWVTDGRKGVVTALDITHDPANGLDAGVLAETLRTARDPRIKYIISNRRIAASVPKDGQPAWAWRPYTGSNPHNKHVHCSVLPNKSAYDSDAPWLI